MNQLNDKLLKDYLLGKCTERQMEKISAWIQESDENARWLFRVEELFHLRHMDKYSDEARIQRAELRLMKEIRRQHKTLSFTLHHYIRYAAVIIAIVLVALYVHKKINDKNELIETEC